MKKASIIVINYNDKLRVRRAIDSALNQTWKNTEVIVVDDGSDNETREIYKEYTDKVDFIQLERDDKTARTPSRARNAGIEKATGDFISVLDSDNYIGAEFVEKLIKLDADVSFCNWEIVGKDNYRVQIERVWNFAQISKNENMGVLENYLKHTHLDHQCLLIRRSYLDVVGHYDERLPRSQDCDLIVRLILGGGIWSFTQDSLFVFEKHEDDQMKTVASVHGKILWSLKNNINISWIFGTVSQSPYYIMSMVKAIQDFSTKEEWKAEYEKSEFKEFINDHKKILAGERLENV